MSRVLVGLCAAAAAYPAIAIAACLRHMLRRDIRDPGPAFTPPVSILKPIHGAPPGLLEAIVSHAQQDYGAFELLLGFRNPSDPALPIIEQARAACPRVSIRAVQCRTEAPNSKVGALIDLAREARFPVLIVNDADIRVPAGYLRRIVGELRSRDTGLVTCLYRPRGFSRADRWEALGTATEFTPSALVAPLFGVSEFGFGSTLAFRREDLNAIGGFAAVSAYLADDYQLGKRLHALRGRNLISTAVVETCIHGGSWQAAWKHQVRWARTIRVSRAGGFMGLPATFTTLWALTAACYGATWWSLGLLALRLANGLLGGWGILRSPDVLRWWPLIPLRDLYSVAVWCAALTGDSVEWGGWRLKLDGHGRIVEKTRLTLEDPSSLPRVE